MSRRQTGRRTAPGDVTCAGSLVPTDERERRIEDSEDGGEW